ncbi:MAG: hypothetical protein JNN13_03000 [Planctomycetes bacterium]|nr:hypothetical protein [Planctomycetota bacterium]
MRAIHLVMAGCLGISLSAQGCLRPSPPAGGWPTTLELFVPVTFGDGYQTIGSLVRPDVPAPSCGWPLLVFVHPLGQNRAFALAAQTALASQGYAVWSYDVRGQGQGIAINAGHPHAGTTLWGPIERCDLAEVIQFVAGHSPWSGIVDATRVAVVGVSQGAAHAWQAAAWSGSVVSAPDRLPMTFPSIACVVAMDLLADPVDDWLRGGGMFSSWFVEAVTSDLPSFRLDPGFAAQCRSAFLAQDPAALAAAFAAEQRGVDGPLATSTVPILYSHAYCDVIASPLTAVARLEQRPAPQRCVLSTIGHGAPINDHELAFRDGLVLRWLHRWLWNVPNGVDAESGFVLGELPLAAAERDDPAHLWNRHHVDALGTGAATRWFLHDGDVMQLAPPLPPQLGASIQQVLDPAATSFTPADYFDQPAVRDLANVLAACPLHERVYSATLAEAAQVARSATLHLRLVPAQPRWQLAALLTVEPPGGAEVMLASAGLCGSVSVLGVAEDHDLRLPPIAARLPAGSVLRLRLRNLWLRESPMTTSLSVAPLFQDFTVDLVHGDAPAGSWLDLPLEAVTPKLVTDHEGLDLAAPAAISYSLRAGPGHAVDPYFVALSFSGHQPGIPFLNDVIPLAGDWLSIASAASTAAPFLGFLGWLDAVGEVTCTFDLSGIGALPQVLNGLQFTAAAFVWDGPWAPTGAASNPCDVLLR